LIHFYKRKYKNICIKMSQNLIMRQLYERQTSQQVKLLHWSPTMDILATALGNGDVCLYRLQQMQRVWAASANEDVGMGTAGGNPENATCTSLCWRPDGKLLASGYSSGLLSIRHIESKESIHTEQLDSKITWISWQNVSQKFVQNGEDDMYSPLSGISWQIMNKLASLENIYSYNDTDQEEVQDCRKFDESGVDSIVLVATQIGSLYILVSGFLMCARLSVSDLFGASCELIHSVQDSDLRTLSCILKQQDSYRLVQLDCPIIASCEAELSVLASKYNLIQGTIQYMEKTIKMIRESWENILLEMDSKLASYAKPNPPGTVAADLMELLLFGTFTNELKTFLVNDMTDKGLKRMGQSIELSYSNIQRLVIKYLHPVCQSLHFQLAELLGVARASHRFSVIGVSEEIVLNAIQESGLFWSKAVELQQIIDESMKKFQLFFRWLYTQLALVRDGTVIPDENKKSTQHDILFIADFIKTLDNSDQDNTDGSSTVYLEKVGQYLGEKDLNQPPDLTHNIWNTILNSIPEIQSAPFILPPDNKSSAVTQFNKLSAAVNKIFNGMNMDITNQTKVKLNLELYNRDQQSFESRLPSHVPGNLDNSDSSFDGDTCGQPNELLCAQLVDVYPVQSADRFIDGAAASYASTCQGAVSLDRSKILFWQVGKTGEVEATWLVPDKNTTIIHFRFYTRDVLSILLECGETQTLVQLPIPNLTSSLVTLPKSCQAIPLDTLNCNNMIEVGGRASCRDLENIRACSFAVSGTRNLSVLLFRNQKRVRIYDMEVEEEEDDEEMFNSSGPLTETTDQN